MSAGRQARRRLARDPSLVVMSLPIDYWDYLGWKDTLALPGHGNRQRAYSKTRGDREVYTPQVVVNGTVHRGQRQGGDRDRDRKFGANRKGRCRCRSACRLTARRSRLRYRRQRRRAEGRDLVCPITKDVPVTIGRGENTGHTVTTTTSCGAG